MSIAEILAITMLTALIPLLALGYPVAFTLSGVGLLFAGLGNSLGVFDAVVLNAIVLRFWGIITNDILLAVPLFILMGVTLEKSGLAEDLLDAAGELLARVRGGIGFAAIAVGALLAASTGIVGATVVTLALISLPAMLKARYDPALSAGLITATGSLAQIIPPSTVLVFLAVIMQSINSQVQLSLGNFIPETISVGELFAAALFPGLALAGLYALYLFAVSWLQPDRCPATDVPVRPAVYRRIVIGLLPTIFLVMAVLGSIVVGIATPTEAAAVGVAGAFVLSLFRAAETALLDQSDPENLEKIRFRLWLGLMALVVGATLLFGAAGVLTSLMIVAVLCAVALGFHPRAGLAYLRRYAEISNQALIISVMVFVIFLGASIFSLVFSRLGGEELVQHVFEGMPGGLNGAIIATMLLLFVLGMFLDTFEVLFIVVPLTMPPLLLLGADPLWLSVLVVIILQTSYITPPFGFSLFFLRGVASDTLQTTAIYRGALPFICLQLFCLILVWAFPLLATWLPAAIY